MQKAKGGGQIKDGGRREGSDLRTISASVSISVEEGCRRERGQVGSAPAAAQGRTWASSASSASDRV